MSRPTRARRALLLIDHGSRYAAANRQLEALAQRVRTLRPDLTVEIAHMEIARPDLLEGVDACARAGAREILVHPYFLAPGRHTRQTLPALLERAAAAHPELRIGLGEPLGEHEKLVELVLERIEQSGFGPVAPKPGEEPD